ncbi:MAG: AAA family ATPase, partial [Brooklawnia sp.]
MDDKQARSQNLIEVIFDRLTEAGLDDEVADLVLAAVEGDAEFDRALGGAGQHYERPDKTNEPAEPAGAYLTGISVEGFRGIGNRVDLELNPGPGLTVITGRNGSGKSTLAEALEIALTGTNRRWSGRAQPWTDGWRNLHRPDPCEVSVGLIIADSQNPQARVHRSWPADADKVDQGHCELRRPGLPAAPIEELGWQEPLTTYRPILSHNELGEVLTSRPLVLFDALSSILGLHEVTEALERLRKAYSAESAKSKAVKDEASAIADDLAQMDDPRAEQAAKLLRARKKDLETIGRLATTSDATADTELRRLADLASLEPPESSVLQVAATRLREALGRVASLGSDPDTEVAGLLEGALRWHAQHEGKPCPVCGGEPLDAGWAAMARSKVEQIREASGERAQANQERDAAERAVRGLAVPVPASLIGDLTQAGSQLRDAWQAFTALPDESSQWPEHIEVWGSSLESLTRQVNQEARAELAEREGQWRPFALRLANWLIQAEEVEQRAGLLRQLKTARDWLRGTGDEIRSARLAPLASKASATWDQLRQESHVELAGMKLMGVNTSRRVDLDVRIDGSDSSALAVMSQGELNALSLSIFLPRATLPESPFRFLVIDDPVQAMDPSKVDGLARVLHQAADTRQVIVFTHDDRLPQSLRRLRLDATILEVVRAENSVVDVRVVENPVVRQWKDAYSLLLDEAVADDVLRRVVPGILRASLEAACQQVVRHTRLKQPGHSHRKVEELLTTQT